MEDDLGFLIVDVQTTKQEDQPRESSVTGDRLQPVIYIWTMSVFG